MPEWVTALEAAVLTGASEIVVLDAVRSGRIQANPLSMGKGSNGVLLVRLRDVQAMVEETSRPAPAPAPPAPSPLHIVRDPVAAAPVAVPVPVEPVVEIVPPAAPVEPVVEQPPAAEWIDTSDIWNELTDTAATAAPAPAAPPAPAPAAPPVAPADPVAGPPSTAPAPSAFAPFSAPVPPAPQASPDALAPPAATPTPVAPPPTVAPPVSAPPAPVVAPPPPVAAAPAVVAPPTVTPPAVTPPAVTPPAATPTPVTPTPAPSPAPTTIAATPAVAAPARTATPPATASSGVWGESTAPPAPAPEIPVAAKAEGSRLRNPKTLAAAILALALLAAAVYVARPGAGNHDHPRVAGSLGAAPPSVVWMIPTPQGDQIAVVGLPKSGPAVAIAVPSDSHVILPAGDISTVGVSANTGPHAQAVAQNVLLRRVGHYLVTTPANFGKLVDALGGISVQTEAPFTFGGHRIQPGTISMKGAMAIAYLSQAGTGDATGRWEDLLAGVLDAAHESSAWGTVGDSDDPVVVSRLLAASTGATVYEMPTEPASGGGIEADREALAKMLPRFGQSLGTLVRIVVVNGSGAPGLGSMVDGKLAPYGFSVLTSENASHFGLKHTTVVASGEKNLAAAQVAARILGVKSVKVSDQPTSLADVTIIAGKDLHG
jgi:hypothetical protein